MERRLDLEAFEACVGEFDASVEASPSIDRFCSRSSWILPFHRAFVPHRELYLYRRGDAFVALAGQRHARIGAYVEPLETMWQFACPLAGNGAVALLADVEKAIAAEHGEQHLTMVLSGIPLAAGLPRELVAALGPTHQLRVADTTTRFVASLAGGLDGWLARRSASFRRNLRAAARRAQEAGVELVPIDVPDAAAARRIYPRILEIERTSWKARTGAGVDSGPMSEFYRDMLPRLASRAELRLLVARCEGRDIGYLHGGALGKQFRGLQMSFEDGYRHLSLGNLLQYAMIGALCEDGFESYDLGSRPGYKERWSEEGLRTATLVCRPAR
jgi:CelD/BcsL family acetyltransferase involved in cellulose biosynthesis